jgi:hypothetical protein
MGSAATGDLAAVRGAPACTAACGQTSAAVRVQATEKLAAFATSSGTRTATTRSALLRRASSVVTVSVQGRRSTRKTGRASQ